MFRSDYGTSGKDAAAHATPEIFLYRRPSCKVLPGDPFQALPVDLLIIDRAGVHDHGGATLTVRLTARGGYAHLIPKAMPLQLLLKKADQFR